MDEQKRSGRQEQDELQERQSSPSRKELLRRINLLLSDPFVPEHLKEAFLKGMAQAK